MVQLLLVCSNLSQMVPDVNRVIDYFCEWSLCQNMRTAGRLGVCTIMKDGRNKCVPEFSVSCINRAAIVRCIVVQCIVEEFELPGYVT